jgi:hypothetical protein
MIAYDGPVRLTRWNLIPPVSDRSRWRITRRAFLLALAIDRSTIAPSCVALTNTSRTSVETGSKGASVLSRLCSTVIIIVRRVQLVSLELF